MQPSPRSLFVALLFLTALALALRLRGLGFGLPVAIEGDCKMARQVELLDSGVSAPERDPDFTWYPLLPAQIARLWPAWKPAEVDASIDEHLAAAAKPLVRSRATIALLSVLVVGATYLLARLWLSAAWSLFASALVATSLLGLSFSQQARPHAATASVFTWAMLAFVRLRQRGDFASYVLAGFAFAAAIGCLQSAVLLVPPLLAAHCLRARSSGSLARHFFDPRALVPLALCVVAIVVFYPFLFAGDSSGEGVLNLSGHLIYVRQFNGKGFAIVLRTLWFYEPVLLGLTVLGALMWMAHALRGEGESPRAERRDLAVVLSFALPYLIVLGLYSRTYERFLLPLLPYLACLSAFGLAHAIRALTRSASIAVACAVLLLAVPAFACVKLAAIRAAPHTTELAAQWMREHVDPTDKVLLTSQLELPLWREREGLFFWGKFVDEMFFLPWARYQARLPEGAGPGPRYRLHWFPLTGENVLKRISDHPDAYVLAQQGDWVVAEVFAENRAHPAGTRLREALMRLGERVARISPDARDDYSDHPLGYQDETSVPPPHFLARVLQARRVGPVIEIYRMRKGEPPR